MKRFLLLALSFVALAVATPVVPDAKAQQLTNTGEDLSLNWLWRTAAVTRPTTWYVALCTDATTPLETGSGCTEPTWTGYARQSVTFGAPANGTGTTREIANTGALSFGDPDNSGTLGYFAIFDASTSGNMLLYVAFAVGVSFQGSGVNDPISFPIGSLKIAQD